MEGGLKNNLLLRLRDLWLCPGDEDGEHVTDNACVCPCGSTNLVPLLRIVVGTTSHAAVIEMLQDQLPGVDLSDIKTFHRS